MAVCQVPFTSLTTNACEEPAKYDPPALQLRAHRSRFCAAAYW